MAKKILTPDETMWQDRTGKKNAQTIINCVLWSILMDKGGTISVSCEQVKNLPETIIHVEVTGQRIYLTAKKEKAEIVMPNCGVYP